MYHVRSKQNGRRLATIWDVEDPRSPPGRGRVSTIKCGTHEGAPGGAEVMRRGDSSVVDPPRPSWNYISKLHAISAAMAHLLGVVSGA